MSAPQPMRPAKLLRRMLEHALRGYGRLRFGLDPRVKVRRSYPHPDWTTITVLLVCEGQLVDRFSTGYCHTVPGLAGFLLRRDLHAQAIRVGVKAARAISTMYLQAHAPEYLARNEGDPECE